MNPWWKDDAEVLTRMLAWDGRGHPPNYLQWAWHNASPSLRKVAAHLPEEVADDLVYQANMTSGQRRIVRVDWFLEKYERA